jgi:hypothetical protein
MGSCTFPVIAQHWNRENTATTLRHHRKQRGTQKYITQQNTLEISEIQSKSDRKHVSVDPQEEWQD